MAHPKHRFSKQRSRKRRTHYKVEEPTLSSCSNCGSTHEFHRVCPSCGYYRGKLAIEKAEATA